VFFSLSVQVIILAVNSLQRHLIHSLYFDENLLIPFVLEVISRIEDFHRNLDNSHLLEYFVVYNCLEDKPVLSVDVFAVEYIAELESHRQ
jgi:hypothetical protein